MKDTIRQEPDRQQLFDIASEQHGYFTTEQAAQCGYARSTLSYHASQGTFQRVSHGVYRFRDYPSSPFEHVVAGWLAIGKDVAVVSHASALELWDLSDVIPDAVHLTVPRERRTLRNRPPPGVVVHTTTRPLGPGEVRRHQGIRVTAPERTILDAAEAGTQPEQIAMAVGQAAQRGWIDWLRLRTNARERGPRVATLVERALTAHQTGKSS